MKEGDKFKIDSYKVKQWEEKRVVSEVEVLETPKKYAKNVLVNVKSLRTVAIVPIKELTSL